MKTLISLLRGINVSGQNRIRMPELKRLYETLEFFNVVTYIQSGNVVFDCVEEDRAKIMLKIETGITQVFEISVKVILRDKKSIKQIIDRNPFRKQMAKFPEKFHITFLSNSPIELAITSLPHPVGSSDEFVEYDKEIYLYCPNGYGRTKFSNTFFERKLGVSATTRNWKTVNALYEIAKQR